MVTDPDALSNAWSAAQERLPDGWQLDGLRCGSTGLAPEQRSDDWLAVATGPDGAHRTFRAADPFDALTGLADSLGGEPRAEVRGTAWDIRDAGLDDLDALNAVYRRSSLSNDGDRALLLAHPEVLVLTAASLAQGRTRVAAVERTVVGFATSSVHDDHLELDALFVDPDWMRRGIAQDLMLDAVAMARAVGLDRIEVTGNDHARAFYAQAGFVPIGVVDTPLGVPAARLRRTVSG